VREKEGRRRERETEREKETERETERKRHRKREREKKKRGGGVVILTRETMRLDNRVRDVERRGFVTFLSYSS